MEIFLTLDYELFMGSKTGTVENCLIKPTNELLAVLDKYNVKATFFVDAAYLYQLNKLKANYYNLNRDYESVVKQLRYLSETGHDIQLHIHPQWFYAKYDGSEWLLNSSPYKLSDMEKTECFNLFYKSKNQLEQIIGKHVSAFRAGGYSIQTFKNLSDLFSENHILIDSSVLAMRRAEGSFQVYDYSNVKPGYSYSFSDDVSIPSKEGSFIEIPITSSKFSPLFVAYSSIMYRLNKKTDRTIFGDGVPIKKEKTERGKKMNSMIVNYWRFLNQRRVASIDTGNAKYLKYIYHSQKNSNIFVIIGHPKNLSKISLTSLDLYLQSLHGNAIFNTISLINKDV